jgi:hypothetical protein
MCGIHFRVDQSENRCTRCGKLLMGENTYFEEEQLCENCMLLEGEEIIENVDSVEREGESKTKPEK